ncbi:hypothetical protein LPJ75_004990, partial [Coemansia sp. RSA 2598]
AIQTLNQLMKRTPSKRTRKERSKQNIDSFIRRTTTKAATAAAAGTDRAAASATTRVTKAQHKKPEDTADKKPLSEAELRLRRNAKTLQAANKLMSQKSKELELEVVELLAAQRERRMPKRKAKKAKLPFFDFEDLD